MTETDPPRTFAVVGTRPAPRPWQARCAGGLSDAGLERTDACRADLVLDLGSGRNGPDVTAAPRLGRWTFRVDGYGVEHVGAACREALLHDRSSVHARLTATLRGSEHVVLREGRLPLRPHSLRRSTTSVLDELAGWPALACRTVARGGRLEGPRILGSAAAGPSPDGTRRPMERGTAGGAARTAACRLRILWNGVRLAWRTLFRHDHWNVGLVRRPIHAFLAPGPESEVEWWDPLPRGRFRADPFGIPRHGRVHLLYEEMSYRSGHGRIVGETRGEGLEVTRDVAMEGDRHFSYPYLLEQDGEIYCLPETGDQGRVALLRAVEFPTKWEPAATLLEGVRLLDGTIFRHGGRWWLVGTDADAGPRHVLLAWHAPELFGPWTPHVGNPVKIDIHAARPAGTPFRHEGELYRPAQDGARSYGSAVVINRVVRLTPDDFAEEEVRRITLPSGSRYGEGIHTLSALGPDRTLVDGKRTLFSLPEFQRRLRAVAGGDRR